MSNESKLKNNFAIENKSNYSAVFTAIEKNSITDTIPKLNQGSQGQNNCGYDYSDVLKKVKDEGGLLPNLISHMV